VRHRNILIKSLAPGGADTEMLASGTKERRDFLASLPPMKRIADPSEIAPAIVHVLADATFSPASLLHRRLSVSRLSH
jgi:NAD(P)-dependent dehydrogenase (short-subunit alcohol dehydrogenase family)